MTKQMPRPLLAAVSLLALSACFSFDRAYDDCAAGRTCAFADGGSGGGTGGGEGGGSGGGAGGGGGGLDAGEDGGGDAGCVSSTGWCATLLRGFGPLEMYRVSVANSQDVWFSGDAVWRYKNGQWLNVSLPELGNTWRGLYATRVPPGTEPRVFIGDWQNGGIWEGPAPWTRIVPITVFADRIRGTPDAGTLYIGAWDLRLLRYRNGQLTDLLDGGNGGGDRYDVWMLNEEDVISVSSYDQGFRYADGGVSSLGLSSGASYYACFAAASDDLWAGGPYTLSHRGPGEQTWANYSGYSANSIWGSGPDNVFIATGSFSSELLRYDGSTFTNISEPGANSYFQIDGEGPNAIYALGVLEDGGYAAWKFWR